MKTQTAERTDSLDDIGESKGAVAVFAAPRLPFHDAIKQRFGIDRGTWKVLVEAIFPAAKSPDSIVMALAYCKARNLDIMKRPVHIVPMWSSATGGMVESVWPGIAELRTTAFRTGNYAGCDEAEFGQIVTQSFAGKVKAKDGWKDKTVEVRFPEWCRITIYRELNGRVCKFVGPKVKWIESYATIGNSSVPNEMWAERPEGQLEKCAEAAALRRAFPEEIGNELTAEEMHGRTIEADARIVSPAIAGSDNGPPDPDAPLAPLTIEGEAGPQNPDDGLDIPAALDRRPKPVAAETIDATQWLKDLDGALGGCEDLTSLAETQERLMKPMKGKVPLPVWKQAEDCALNHCRRINTTVLDAG